MIRHIVLRRDLFDLTEDHTKALILSYLFDRTHEHRIHDRELKVKQDRMEEANVPVSAGWIPLPGSELSDVIMVCVQSTASRKLRELEEEGYVSSRHNPNGWDRTKEYRLELNRIEEDLREKGYVLRGLRAADVYRLSEDPEPEVQTVETEEAPPEPEKKKAQEGVQVHTEEEGEDAKAIRKWRGGAAPHPWTAARIEKDMSRVEDRQEAVAYCGWMCISLYGDEDHKISDVFGYCHKIAGLIERITGEAGQGPSLLAQSLLHLADPPPPNTSRADFRPWRNEKRRRSLPTNVLTYIQEAAKQRHERKSNSQEQVRSANERAKQELDAALSGVS
jgi:DNA-binding MarR family transcriptional regulator